MSGLGWSDEKLQEYFAIPSVTFVGDECGECKATANVLASHGWFCLCGHFNVQNWYTRQFPHAHPAHGPTGETLRRIASEVRGKAFAIPNEIPLRIDSLEYVPRRKTSDPDEVA